MWTYNPAFSHAFTFFDKGSFAESEILSAGLPGPASIWKPIVPPAKPGSSYVRASLPKPDPQRFGMLVYSKQSASDIDVKVRFQILAGNTSPAVGIVFGYQNPTSYYVLRYNRATNDLALIRMTQPEHETLQKTDLAETGVAELASADVQNGAISNWHTLRLLSRGGIFHGWIDQNKRISVDDHAYTGGKVGLWLQGDTVAAFSNWTVDVYDNAAPTP